MTATDWLTDTATVQRRLLQTIGGHRHPAGDSSGSEPNGVMLTKEAAPTETVADPFAGVSRLVSLGARLAFVGWLFVVTDGYAFATITPLSLLRDVVGGSLWPPLMTAAGLAGVLVRTRTKVWCRPAHPSVDRTKNR